MDKSILFRALLVAAALLGLSACTTAPDYAAQYRPIQDDFIAVWNGAKLSKLDDMVAPKFQRHGTGAAAEDLAALKQTIILYRTAFSDLKVTIDDAWYMKDRGFYRWTVTGTNNGAGLEGQAPTGKSMKVSGISAVTYIRGQIVDELIYYDRLELYEQLGYILSPPS